jgi:hypothetical protein
MASNKQLRENQINEILNISDEWIKFFGIEGLVKRFNTTEYLIKKAMAQNIKLKNKIGNAELVKKLCFEWKIAFYNCADCGIEGIKKRCSGKKICRDCKSLRAKEVYYEKHKSLCGNS